MIEEMKEALAKRSSLTIPLCLENLTTLIEAAELLAELADSFGNVLLHYGSSMPKSDRETRQLLVNKAFRLSSVLFPEPKIKSYVVRVAIAVEGTSPEVAVEIAKDHLTDPTFKFEVWEVTEDESGEEFTLREEREPPEEPLPDNLIWAITEAFELLVVSRWDVSEDEFQKAALALYKCESDDWKLQEWFDEKFNGLAAFGPYEDYFTQDARALVISVMDKVQYAISQRS